MAPLAQHGSVLAQAQPAANVQLLVQHASEAPNPGSHSSPPSRMPSPQIAPLGGVKLSSRQVIVLAVTSRSKAATVEPSHTPSPPDDADMIFPEAGTCWSP